MAKDTDRPGVEEGGGARSTLLRLGNWAAAHVVPLVGVVFVVVYVLARLGDPSRPPVHADGVTYYAYLPALLVHQDLSFERLADEHYEGCFPPGAEIKRDPATGRYVNMYNVGVAVLMSPFFLVAHLITLAVGWVAPSFSASCPADGYSLLYQHAAGLAGLSYVLGGLWLLRRVLLRRFAESVVAATLLGVVFGTNLFHYAAVEPVQSHAYSFFLFCALLALVPRWYACPQSVGLSVLLGVVCGLIPMVRTPNALFPLVFGLYGVLGIGDVRARGAFILRNALWIVLVAVVALLVFSPQMLVWKNATGRWLANMYGILHPELQLTAFSRPRILQVLFSLRGGVCFWSPIVVLALIGFVPMRQRAGEYFTPVVLFLVCHIYLVASWHDWAMGGGFGHRGFVETYSFFAIGLASLYGVVWPRAGRAARVCVLLVSILLVLYELFFMYLYYAREIPAYGLDRQALFDIFWSRKEMLLDFLRTIL